MLQESDMVLYNLFNLPINALFPHRTHIVPTSYHVHPYQTDLGQMHHGPGVRIQVSLVDSVPIGVGQRGE